MYILKNAITSIVRNKGRNILIGIVIIVIAASISITLAINNTSASLINSFKNKYATTATIGINRENMMKDFDSENKDESKKNMQEAFSSISSLSVSDIKKFANSKYVKSYFYTMQLGVNSSTLEKASMTNNSSDSNENGPSYDKAPDGVRGAFSNATSGDFTLIGYSSIDAMNEFIEGSYKITSGKVPTDFNSDTCLINKELATLNNISVGDKITITDPDDSSKTYELENVSYRYNDALKDDYVFKNINYEFNEGKVYAIKGKSGSGKTTLLSLLSGLETNYEGNITYNGKDLKKQDLDKYRSSDIGIIFQSYNLLPHLTAMENIILSLDISNVEVANKSETAIELMKSVGLKESQKDRRVLKLSGGEQQRVAIARSLSYNPRMILADEPTGNLDKETENEILKIFKNLAKRENKCVIIVTHSENVCQNVDVIFDLKPQK